MPSLRKENDRGRIGYRLQFRQGKQRRSIWLGNVSKRTAEGMARSIDALAIAKASNVAPDPEATRWASGLEGRIRKTLETWCLIDAGLERNNDSDRFLGSFCDRYIQGRTDVSQATRKKYGHTKRFLVGMFGEDRQLKTITKSDAKTWQRWLAEQVVKRDKKGRPVKRMAPSTASKHVKRAKTMFGETVDARLIDENPMDAIKGGDEVNRDRDFFIDRDDAAKVLDFCPDHDWRLVFSLARFGGLRVCELLTVTWSDIQWSESRIRIDSPKTGLRFSPIYPELLPHLEASFDAAPDGRQRCLGRFTTDANLGTTMNRIIQRAGLAPWEKTFQNLRATRRTELEECYPNHVVNAWMGHSAKVAAKSYLQVTPDHWTLGATQDTAKKDTTSIGGVRGGVIHANPLGSRPIAALKNPVKQATDSSETRGFGCIAPRKEPLSLQTRKVLSNLSTETAWVCKVPVPFGLLPSVCDGFGF